MNWLHAFRYAGGEMREHQVNEVRAFLALLGYRTVVDMWWIEEVWAADECIYRRTLGDGLDFRRREIIRQLPDYLIGRLNNRFGPYQIDDSDTEFEVLIDDVLAKPKVSPNVGAATILPLP